MSKAKTTAQILKAAGFSSVIEGPENHFIARAASNFSKAHETALQTLGVTTKCHRQTDALGPYLVVDDSPVPSMDEPVTDAESVGE